MNSKPKILTVSVLVHISGLLISIIGPILFYLFSESDFIQDNAFEALEWQILFLIMILISYLISLLIPTIYIVVYVLPILNLIFCLYASYKAYYSKVWNYGFDFRITEYFSELT